MANIALDIKANTTKALGEFKKLSRELDNKFLVQGLKLDVVKNAFRQITKEFDNALGDQGLRTAETTGQVQRSLQLQLTTLRKFNGQVSKEVSESLTNLLLDLQAQGKITGDTLRDSLNIASLLDFEGSTAERKRQFEETTKQLAGFIQQTKDLFGSDEAALLRRGFSGELGLEDVLNYNFTSGGAAGNALKAELQKYAAQLKSIDPSERAKAFIKAFEGVQDLDVFQQELADVRPIEAIKRQLQGLFSPKGLFGALRVVTEGDQILNLQNNLVDRNLLQVTGKLLGTLFDREQGLFAVLFKSLGEVFGEGDPLNVILNGVEAFTGFIERIRDFFGSDQFKGILEFFVPIIDSIKSIFSGNFEFNKNSINALVDNIFEGIRGLINNITEYIKSLDAEAIGSVLGNITSELTKLILPLISAVFSGITKLISAGFSAAGAADNIVAKLLLGGGTLAGGAFLANRITAPPINYLTRRQGGVAGVVSRRTDQRFRSAFFNANKMRDGGRRGLGREFIRNLLRRGGGTTSYESGNPDLARGGGFDGWQSEVIRKFNQIIIIMRDAVPVYMKRPNYNPNAGGFSTGSGGNPRGPFGPAEPPLGSRARRRLDRQGSRLGRAINRADDFVEDRVQYEGRRARVMGRRNLSLAGRNLRRLPGGIRNRTTGAIRGIGALASGLGGFITGPDYDLMGTMADDYMFAGTNYMAPIGPLPLNSRDPYAENFATGGYDPRMISDLTPQMRENRLMDRYNRRMAYRRSFGGRMSGLRRGLGRGVRGLGRLGGPLAGAALTAFSLASLFGGDANAGEMEGMTAEDQRQMRRDRNRQVLGGLAGIAGGAAGGALLGSAFGPVGTVLGGVLGGFLGEEAVKSLSDPIIDGIGDFANQVGDFFKDLWGGAVNLVSGGFNLIKGGIKNLMWFFGSEGPIMTVARFMVDLPGNIIGKVKQGFEAVGEGFLGLGKSVINAIGNFFNPDERFLGGVGTGLTLVGENGPELVNLGTGSVVTPQTSFAGLGVGRSQQAPITNNVVINVNAPGSNEFADTLTVQVIDKLEEMYETQKALQGPRL